MIAVDTSALMAIVLNEPDADACVAALETDDDLLISAGTVAEALIVSARRNVGEEMERLIDGLGFEVVSVTDSETVGRVPEVCRAKVAAWFGEAGEAPFPVGACLLYRKEAA